MATHRAHLETRPGPGLAPYQIYVDVEVVPEHDESEEDAAFRAAIRRLGEGGSAFRDRASHSMWRLTRLDHL